MNRSLIAALSLSAAALLTQQALVAAPPGWAPAHGYRAQHRYVYYPQHQIYYAPDRDLWFWIDGGDWRVGASLPTIYQRYTVGGVSVELDAARPYDRHGYVVEHYGQPRGAPHSKGRTVKHHPHR